MHKLSVLLLLTLLLVMMLFSSAQVGVAQQGTPIATLLATAVPPVASIEPGTSYDDILIRLDGIEKRADSAVNFANNLLNIFQIVGSIISILSVLIGVAVAGGVFFQWRRFDRDWEAIKLAYFGDGDKKGKFQELEDKMDKQLATLQSILLGDENGQKQGKFGDLESKVNEQLNEMQTAAATTEKFRRESSSVLQKMEQIDKVVVAKLANLEVTGRQQNEAIALAQLGQQQIALGNLTLAMKFYEQAYNLDQENTVLRFFLGELYVRLERLVDGIALLEKSLGYAPARLSLAYAKRLLGDDPNNSDDARRMLHSEAERLFSEERERNTENKALLDITGESAYGALAGLFKRQGRDQEARDLYLEASKLTPQSSYPVNNLGILEFRLGNPQQAILHFKRALALAERRIIRDGEDYYAWHDRVTAKVVIGYDLKEIFADLDEAFLVTRGIEPLRKLEKGLRDLAKMQGVPSQAMQTGVLPDEPDEPLDEQQEMRRHYTQIIHRIHEEIKRREHEQMLAQQQAHIVSKAM